MSFGNVVRPAGHEIRSDTGGNDVKVAVSLADSKVIGAADTADEFNDP